MKLIKILTAFIALVSLQIAAAQWLNVPSPVEAKNLMIFTAGVPVVAAGYVLEVDQSPAIEANNDVAWDANTVYTSGSFYVEIGFTATRVIVDVRQKGTPTMTYTCYLFADSAEKPTGAALGTSTNTIAGGDMPAAFGTGAVFNFVGTALSSATRYHAVLYGNSYDWQNTIEWGYGPYEAGTQLIHRSPDGTTWLELQHLTDACLKVYSGG